MVCTPGWTSSQRRTWSFQRVHSARKGSGRAVVAADSRHWLSSNETPRHPRRRATTSSAARQWTAWLSPTSAKLTGARVAGRPNAQAAGPVRDGIGVHGALGTIGASRTLGLTQNRSARVRHGCSGSRDAAPRQRGAPAGPAAAPGGPATTATVAAASATASRRDGLRRVLLIGVDDGAAAAPARDPRVDLRRDRDPLFLAGVAEDALAAMARAA